MVPQNISPPMGKKMIKSLALAALIAVGMASSANAATLDILLGGTDGTHTNAYALLGGGNIGYTTTGETIVGNVPTGSIALGPNSEIVTGSLVGQYVQPTNITSSTPYLAVHDAGSASFVPSAGNNSFGFTWGTIDEFNTFTIQDQ